MSTGKFVCANCQGKAYADLPNAFKFFIEAQFRTIDVDGNIVFNIYSNLNPIPAGVLENQDTLTPL